MAGRKFLSSFFFAISIALFFFACKPAIAIEYGGIGGRPAYPRAEDPHTQSIFIHEVKPGQVIKEAVNVINNSQSAKTLMIYGADSTPSTDGGFACKQLAEKQTDVGTWIKLAKTQVTLSSVKSEIIPFTITIPKDAEVGEHNGCILIQEKKQASQKAGVNISFRTGLRVLLTVPGEIIKSLRIVNFELSSVKEAFVLKPSIKNSGNVSTDGTVYVIVKNVLGKQVAKFGGEYNMLRGETSSWNFEFKKPFWGGYFSAQTVLSYNNGTENIELESKKISFFSAPSLTAAAFIGLTIGPLLALIVILFLYIRLRRKKSS